MFHISFDDEKDNFYEEIWPFIPQIGSYIHFSDKNYPDDEEMEDVYEVTAVFHGYPKNRSKVLVFMKK